MTCVPERDAKSVELQPRILRTQYPRQENKQAPLPTSIIVEKLYNFLVICTTSFLHARELCLQEFGLHLLLVKCSSKYSKSVQCSGHGDVMMSGLFPNCTKRALMHHANQYLPHCNGASNTSICLSTLLHLIRTFD